MPTPRQLAIATLLLGSLIGCQGASHPIDEEPTRGESLLVSPEVPDDPEHRVVCCEHDDNNDLCLDEIAAELGLIVTCQANEICCHGGCVTLEDAEAHGC